MLVDLRSDTVARPSPGLRRAMADAEVGDGVDVLGPTRSCSVTQRALQAVDLDAAVGAFARVLS